MSDQLWCKGNRVEEDEINVPIALSAFRDKGNRVSVRGLLKYSANCA